MATIPFIWLGARRSRKVPIGSKGRLLDVAASRGLPVPNGGILLDELYQLLRAERVIVQQDGRIITPDPAWLHETLYTDIHFPRLDKAAAVRAAFATQQGDDPGAALFPGVLHVNVGDAPAMSAALCAVWSAALAHGGALRRDVLVMEMVAAQCAGTAVTHPAQKTDTVTLSDGGAMILPRLRRWQRPSTDLPPFAQRLQQLLRGTRRTFGPGDWQISWADDGLVCWLIQIAKI